MKHVFFAVSVTGIVTTYMCCNQVLDNIFTSLVMWFCMKRVRLYLVDKKLGLMKGKFVADLAAVSADLSLWIPLWLGTQMKVTERG